MFSKMSPIKCEPQNILSDAYIKQEHIDESTEYNDSNDGEFTYQWSLQDSEYTTDNVEAQIKSEVDIYDDVMYESFFKRENYNYDPSIIMCHTSTTYDIKSKPANCNLNIQASTIKLKTAKKKSEFRKKKQYFFQNEVKSEKPYTCGTCNKSFSLKGTLKTHLWIHMKDKPYKCFICNKSFSQASTLITHKIIHKPEKPFNCNFCKKSFAQKINMKTHMMFHMGEKYNKKICNKTILLKEYYTKTLAVEDPYKSATCNKLSSRGTTVSTRKNIRNDKIPFECNICKKSFSYKGNLKTHLRIHTKEKPYKCNICNKSFSQRGSLKIHTRIHERKNHVNAIYEKKNVRSDQLHIHTKLFIKSIKYLTMLSVNNLLRKNTIIYNYIVFINYMLP